MRRRRSNESAWTLLVLLVASSLWLCTRAMSNGDEFNCIFKGCRCGGGGGGVGGGGGGGESTVAAGIAASANDYDEPDEPSVNDGDHEDDDTELDIVCMLDESSTSGDFPHRVDVDLNNSSRFHRRNISDIQVISQNIVEIPGNRFANLSITYASLQGNRIQFLRSEVFKGIVKLEILDLKNNNIKYIEKMAFAPLSNTLIELCLEGNKLSETPRMSALTDSFAHLKSLVRLNLARNNLSQIHELKELVKLSELNLAYNQIRRLRGALLPPSIVDLNLASNRIESLSNDSFTKLSNLKYLNLDDNQITFIESGAFRSASRLVVLNLARNSLRNIPSRALLNLGFLERIDLSSQKTQLKSIHDYAFDRFDNELTSIRIDLSRNKIYKMGERAFCSRNSEISYAHISDLDLGGNPVGQLNACILRQMWKGLSARNSTQHRAKLSFKEPVPGLQRAVKCDCNVTISTVYVEMEGECERAGGNTRSLEELDKFHCDAYKHRQVQLEDVEAECDALIQYDCTKFIHDAGVIHPAPPLSSPPNEFIPKTVQSEETAHDNPQLSQERTSLLVHKTASNSSQQIQTTSPSPQPKQYDREIVASKPSKQSKEIAQGNGFAPRLQPSIYMFFAAAFLITFLN